MKNPFDDSFDFSNFMVAAPPAHDTGATTRGAPDPAPVLGGPIDVPQEELQAEAAFAASGSGGTGSVVTVGGATSAGLTINLMFDSAAMAAPQSFRDGITQAMQMICAVVTDHITLNIQIDYSGTGKGAFAGPSGGNYVAYSTVHSDLVNNASPGDTTFNSLPSGSTIAGQSQVAVWYSQEKLWGLISPTGTEIDGSASFATDIDPTLLVGVALHELTHAMGRVPYGPQTGQTTPTPQPDIFDFFRFTSAGNILIDGNNTAAAAYFSLDGGAHKLADYGQTSDPSDFLNSGVQGSTDPFNEYYGPGTQQQLTAIDLKQLDALGFHLVSNQPTTVIEAFGATALVQVGNNYFLNPVAGGTGPEVIFGSAPLTVGQFTWTPIGAEKTSTGYEIALKSASTGLYTEWLTDSLGNVTYDPIGNVSGTSTTLENLEVSFQQDLNGDGFIGVPPPTTVIEAVGATALVQVGNNYFLDPVAGGTGPEVIFGSAPLTVGQFTWTPIGAEKTSTGYEIALKSASTGLYTEWLADSHGNVTYDPIGNVSGTSTTLENLEVSFQQDLNGDHVIGVPTAPVTVIEANGLTALVQIGNNYFLDPAAAGTGPEVIFGSAPLTVGEFTWTPIGAEQTSTGYAIVLMSPSTGLYTEWLTDGHGNVTYDPIGNVSGTSTTLENLEVTFQQDLNGDHIIGVPGPTSPAPQVASAAPTPPAALTAGDTFTFRSDFGGTVSNSAAPPSGEQVVQQIISTIEHVSAELQQNIEHFSTELQQIVAGDLSNLAGAHDNTAHGPLFDLLHGFMIH